jgi:hypothetical protein
MRRNYPGLILAIPAILAPALALLLAGCRAATPLAAPARVLGTVSGDAQSRLIVDSVHHQVILYAGPFRVPGMASMAGMPEMPGMSMSGMKGEDEPAEGGKENHAAHAFSPLVRFVWPVDGWYRGFEVSLVDSAGVELPQHMMHHLVGVDFAHRQLLEGDLVRFIAAGVETHNVVLPRFLGVPMKSGQQLGIYAGWHNPGSKDLEGVYIRLAMPYLPANTLIKPISVFPVQMDVDNTPGQPDVYDLPPGKTTRTFEFKMPISGRFLGVGGHLHDYGVELRLEDAKTGEVISKVESVRDAQGHVEAVGRRYYPVMGLRMDAGRSYRVVGAYDTPSKDTVMNGAMAIMAGVFAPNDPSQWPVANVNDPETRADLESLPGGSKVTAPVIGAVPVIRTIAKQP